MKKSKEMAIYMVATIIQRFNDAEFSRVNYRANSGDIIAEITDGDYTLILNIDPSIENFVTPTIHEAKIRFYDEEFQLALHEVANIRLSERLAERLREYFNTEVPHTFI